MKTELKIKNFSSNQIAILGFKTKTPQNTFNLDNLEDLIKLLKQVFKDNDAVILHSLNETFFSSGLNLDFFQNESIKIRRELLQLMVKCFRILLSLKKFWICEINGHCTAGGLVIVLASDYRYMLLNSGRIGFSEIPNAHFFLPQSYIESLHYIVKPNYIRHIIEGKLFKSKLAEEIGLIDKTFNSKEEMRKASIFKIKQILKLNQKAFLISRGSYRNNLIQKIKKAEILDYKSIENFI